MFGRFAALVALFLLGGATGPRTTAGLPAGTPAGNRAAASPLPPGALSPRNASYTIAARLDPARRALDGIEVITWRNTASIPASSLRFHLYYNAWRNSASSWMRERRLGVDPQLLVEPPEADWGWIDITRIQLLNGNANAHGSPEPPAIHLAGRREPGRPDGDGGAARPRGRAGRNDQRRDRVDARACRARSRAPARSATTTSSRSGFRRSACFEDTGWNCHQFHSPTEFFADFGIYDVSLTVPDGWIVGATGREGVGPARRDVMVTVAQPPGTTTHRFYQEDVHDFAWTTSPDYVERRARFEHPTLPAVDMRLLLQPEHAGQADRHFDATRATLKYYGEWYGAYPYGHVTIVDPAWNSEAGGMEYPTLFTAGTRWIAPRGVTEPEGVTVHEAGHQWWYGVVATNEFEHAWMDEGLNTFSTARVIEQAFQPNYYSKRYFGGFVPWVFRDFPLKRETDGDRLGPVPARRTGGRPVDADLAVLAADGGRRHATTRRRCGCTRWSGCSDGTRCSGFCPRTIRGGRSGIRGRMISSRWSTRSADGT